MELKTNFEGTFRDLATIRNEYPAAAKAIAIEFTEQCVKTGQVEGIVPRDSGDLRSTLRKEIRGEDVFFVAGGIAGQSGDDVDYAVYVNNGTSRQPPQFYMERTVFRVATMSYAIYKQTIDSWLVKTRQN